MADKQIPKLSGSGITIGGSKTLEQFIAEQEAKEESDEYFSEGRKPLYVKPRSRIEKIMKKKGGVVRIYSRREININHWKEHLMNLQSSKLSQTAKLDRAILQILLSGKEIIGRDLATLVMEALPEITKKSYDIRASHLTRQTDLSKLVEIRKVGNNNCFKLVTPALDLTVEELHVFAYKSWQKRHEVLEKYKSLRPYFEEEKPSTQIEVTRELDTEEIQPDKEPEMPDLSRSEKIHTEINDVIGQAISKALGIEVNVSGRVEFVFKLGN